MADRNDHEARIAALEQQLAELRAGKSDERGRK
jgi:hypothetical protein